MSFPKKPVELYCIDFPNGKKYIGVTSKGIENRIKSHINASARIDSKLYRAIKKHGIENLSVSYLGSINDPSEAEIVEKAFIELYDTKSNGYNSTEGGEGIRGFIYTEKARENISIAQKARFKNPEERLKASLAEKKWIKENPELAEKRNAVRKEATTNNEHREKMSRIMKTFYASNPDLPKKQGETLSAMYKENPKLRTQISRSLGGTAIKAIFQDGEELVFSTMTECARELGLSSGNIGMVLSGKRNQTGGYIFERTIE